MCSGTTPLREFLSLSPYSHLHFCSCIVQLQICLVGAVIHSNILITKIVAKSKPTSSAQFVIINEHYVGKCYSPHLREYTVFILPVSDNVSYCVLTHSRMLHVCGCVVGLEEQEVGPLRAVNSPLETKPISAASATI